MPKKSDSTVGRRSDILQLLAKKGSVQVSDLSRMFKVSEVTIRNDLEQLEQKNTLIRARGGAMRMDASVAVDQRLDDKSKLHLTAKRVIGACASQLVSEADTIIIDSGSTTAELVKSLPEFQDLTVITNALNIANLIGNRNNINMIMLGGYLRKNSLSLVGPLAEKSLQLFTVDKVFLGVDGFDTRNGIYTPNMEEARLNELMIETAREVIVLVDSSKFKRRSLALICPVGKINKVITDSGVSADDYKRMEDSGIAVTIAK